MTCRWCGRQPEHALSDECDRCAARLNSIRMAHAQPPQGKDVRAYFEGCTLSILEDYKPCTRIEWGWNANEARVRDDIVIFFRHADRIKIDRLTWGEERRW